jgi:hypothetical protein
VVGDDQAARRDAAERRIQLDAEDVEQAPRPALLQRQPAGVADPRIDQRNGDQPAQQVRGEAEDAQGADDVRRRCRLQSRFPRKWRA